MSTLSYDTVLQSIGRRMLRHLTLDLKFDFDHCVNKAQKWHGSNRECILRESSLLSEFPNPKVLARDGRPSENRPPGEQAPRDSNRIGSAHITSSVTCRILSEASDF